MFRSSKNAIYFNQQGQTNVMEQQTCSCLPQRIKNNNGNNYKFQDLTLIIAQVGWVSTAKGEKGFCCFPVFSLQPWNKMFYLHETANIVHFRPENENKTLLSWMLLSASLDGIMSMFTSSVTEWSQSSGIFTFDIWAWSKISVAAADLRSFADTRLT